jgi:hypothetical protein
MDDAFVDGCGLPRQVKRETHGFSRLGQVNRIFSDKAECGGHDTSSEENRHWEQNQLPMPVFFVQYSR